MFCVKCGKNLTRLLQLSKEITDCPFCGQPVDRAAFDREMSEAAESTESGLNVKPDVASVPDNNFPNNDFNDFELFSDGIPEDIPEELISDELMTEDISENPNEVSDIGVITGIKTPGDALRYIIDKDGLSAIKKSNHKKLYEDLCSLIPKKELKAVKIAIDRGAVDILYEAGQKNSDKSKAVKKAYEFLASKAFVSNEIAGEGVKAFEFGLRWDKETLENESMMRLQKVLNYQKGIDIRMAKLEVSANDGDINAMKEIADHYFDNGVNGREYKRAFDNYKAAALKGDIYSMYRLGCCYRRGIGVKQNLPEAYNCFLKASAESVEAIRNIAEFYNKGLYVEKDSRKEVYWLTKAAYMGDARSQCELGKYFLSGHGTNVNIEKAAYWFGKAAEQNDPVGQLNLGNCYKNGQGVSVDYEKAVEYYTLAAEQDNPQAQYLLGIYYYWGRGVGQEYDTAVHWLTKAAKQGLPIAAYVLARCYETGSGVNRSFTQALRWYTDAYESGYDKAKKDCERVELKLKGKFDIKKGKI
ncbi:MAG: SEL1-like repeat protein [Oscillospiraceae bacterium]|nr:SEL1-like repeat protein [Oscillospiraceae bacterium]